MEYVLYLRASPQRLITRRFLQPGDRILSEYIEVESGRKNNRPEMAKAIVATRRASTTLLVAEIPRLARSIYFTYKLMKEKVRFKACDIPYVDEFTINILAAIAQKAAKNISSTKRGLAAKKARGFELGNPQNFIIDSRALGRTAAQRNAQEHVANKQARRLIVLLRCDGLTLAAIADELNTYGYRTRRGQPALSQEHRLRLLPRAQLVAPEPVTRDASDTRRVSEQRASSPLRALPDRPERVAAPPLFLPQPGRCLASGSAPLGDK